MEFKIDKETFSRALHKIQGIVEKRNTMPILSNVLIEAQTDRIEVTATDLEVGMKSSYETTVYQEGKVTVAAKKLYEIIKELPDDLTSDETCTSCDQGPHAVIISDKGHIPKPNLFINS